MGQFLSRNWPAKPLGILASSSSHSRPVFIHLEHPPPPFFPSNPAAPQNRNHSSKQDCHSLPKSLITPHSCATPPLPPHPPSLGWPFSLSSSFHLSSPPKIHPLPQNLPMTSPSISTSCTPVPPAPQAIPMPPFASMASTTCTTSSPTLGKAGNPSPSSMSPAPICSTGLGKPPNSNPPSPTTECSAARVSSPRKVSPPPSITAKLQAEIRSPSPKIDNFPLGKNPSLLMSGTPMARRQKSITGTQIAFSSAIPITPSREAKTLRSSNPRI